MRSKGLIYIKNIWKEDLIVIYCSVRFPWLWITYLMCSNTFIFRLKISLSAHVDKSSSATLAVQPQYSMFLTSLGRHFNGVLLKMRYIYMQGFHLRAKQQANWLAVSIRGGLISRRACKQKLTVVYINCRASLICYLSCNCFIFSSSGTQPQCTEHQKWLTCTATCQSLKKLIYG